MKTIDEAAKDYLKNVIGCVSEHAGKCAIHDFTEGVMFAQRWIPIDEELPNNDERVLTKFENGKVIVNCYDTCLGEWQYQFHEKYTHWRPIELL